MKRIIIFLFLLNSLGGCDRAPKEKTLSGERETIQYEINLKEGLLFPAATITCNGIIREQQIRIELEITNPAKEVIEFSSNQFELESAEGNRSLPKYTEPERLKLNTNQSGIITLVYEPVHSRKLYQNTSLRGDLEIQYTLRLIQHSASGDSKNESVTFLADSDPLTNSINKFGLRASTTPYVLSVPDGFIQKQNEHLQKFVSLNEIRTSHNVQVNGNEILCDGLWTKIEAFYKTDTLNLKMRFVNQSGRDVTIDESLINMVFKEDTLISRGPKRTFKLLNGDRGFVSLAFPVEKKDEYEIFLNGIRLSDSNILMYARPIKLRITGYE
jgi:hypothetical protein